MKKTTLLLKGRWRTALLVLLGIVGTEKGYATYDFSAVCETGQTLYYNITDEANHYVEMTFPGTYVDYTDNPWYGFALPTGNLVMPESVVYNGITYSVTSIGPNTFYDCSGPTSVVIPNSVTSIGGGAFLHCESLTSVTIGNSVTYIGDVAFDWCYGLTSVIIADLAAWCGINFYGVTSNPLYFAHNLYFNNSLVTNLTIPNSVTSIGNYAFSSCRLTSVEIPNSVTSIGNYAFRDCNRLLSIKVKATVPPSLGTNVFQNVPNNIPVVVPYGSLSAYQNAQGWNTFTHFIESEANTIEFVDANMEAVCLAQWDTNGTGQLSLEEAAAVTDLGTVFMNNTNITSFDELQYFTGLSSIGNNTFEGCTGLTSITIPISVTSIGRSAFYGCSSLVSLTIPNAVNHIGEDAFTGTGWYNNQSNGILYLCNWCLGYKGNSPTGSLTIQDGTKSIADNAFDHCSGLTSVSIPNSVSFLGNYVFAGCSGLATVVLPKSITSIGLGLFQDCSSLTSIEIPNSVTFIGDVAFYNCSGLTNITIPNSVTTIGGHGEGAFSKCSNLTSIIIPQAVTFLGDWTFSFCSRLTTVYYNAENASGYGIFTGCPNLTTINIGTDVKEIHSGVFENCNSVHFVVALGPTPAVLEQGTFSDIANNTILMVSCGNRVTYFSVWNMFDFNNIIENCDEYLVSTNNVGAGGTVTASPVQAQMGQTVTLTARPNTGMVLSSLSVANAGDPTQIIPVSAVGKAASTYSFVMPPFNVAVVASFAAGTGVDERNSIAASIYPNPTNGQIKIETESLKHITISNMLGQCVYESKVNGNEFAYDFRKHETGVYIVRIEMAEGAATKRVVVTR